MYAFGNWSTYASLISRTNGRERHEFTDDGRRIMISRKWLAGLLLCLGFSGANAVPQTALYLAMDGSGSISNSDFTTQISGYVGALNNVFTNNPSFYGQVAIGVSIFGRDVQQFFAVQTINNAGDLASLSAAISALDPGRGTIDTSATAIGAAINGAASALTAFEASFVPGVDLNLVIDVTTDGENNVDPTPGPVANNLVNIVGSIDAVNCLGLGGGADCSWTGTAGTDFGSVSFADLVTALESKIVVEVNVPEPGMLALMGIGLAMMGLVCSGIRRRKDGRMLQVADAMAA